MERVAAQLRAIQAAQMSDSDGLRESVGAESTELADIPDVASFERRFGKVAAWCAENGRE